MSVIVFVENDDNKNIKKTSLEAVSYAFALGGDVSVIVVGDVSDEAIATIGQAGGTKVYHQQSAEAFEKGALAYVSILEQVINTTQAQTLVMAQSSVTSTLGARIAAKYNAAFIANIVALPDENQNYKQAIYTGKAFNLVKVNTSFKVLAIKKNTIDIKTEGQTPDVEEINAAISEIGNAVNVIERDKAEGQILLPEADLVVSAGRGLKGPENWGMIEELAEVLGAATGCSKPVSDMEWRPHHEHVGQTGIKVSPSLYIAIGISGAVQHLAGVNSSKYIVVINKDPEAPFFSAADYGIVGDAFDVVPKLIDSLKKQ